MRQIYRLHYLVLTSLPSQIRKQPLKILTWRTNLDTIPPVSRTCVVLSGCQALSKCLSLSTQLTIVNTTLSLPLSHEKNGWQFKSVAEQRPHWDSLSPLSACHHSTLPVNKRKPKIISKCFSFLVHCVPQTSQEARKPKLRTCTEFTNKQTYVDTFPNTQQVKLI